MMMIVAIDPPTAARPITAAPPNIPAPTPAFLPFSIISTRASSISWRTRSETSRERSLTSSETGSCRFSASLSRILIADSPSPGRRRGDDVAGCARRRRPLRRAVALVARAAGARLVAAPAGRLQGSGDGEADEQPRPGDDPRLATGEVLDVVQQLLRLDVLQVAAHALAAVGDLLGKPCVSGVALRPGLVCGPAHGLGGPSDLLTRL